MHADEPLAGKQGFEPFLPDKGRLVEGETLRRTAGQASHSTIAYMYARVWQAHLTGAKAFFHGACGLITAQAEEHFRIEVVLCPFGLRNPERDLEVAVALHSEHKPNEGIAPFVEPIHKQGVDNVPGFINKRGDGKRQRQILVG